MCYGGNNHCWRNDENYAREGNDGRVSWEDKMEYLVMLVITLVVIAYMLNNRDKK